MVMTLCKDSDVRNYYRTGLLPCHGPNSRTRCSPFDATFRTRVRSAVICSVFPFVRRLSSTASRDRITLLLFDGFPGTMQLSDFPEACASGVWLPALPDRPSPPS